MSSFYSGYYVSWYYYNVIRLHLQLLPHCYHSEEYISAYYKQTVYIALDDCDNLECMNV